MANSSSFMLNTQIEQVSNMAKSLNLISWDDYKSAYVIGKSGDDLNAAMEYLQGIADSDADVEAYYGISS